jgi:hypothetical protein
MTQGEFDALTAQELWDLWGLIPIEGLERKIYHCPRCTVFTDLRSVDETIGTHCPVKGCGQEVAPA